MQLIWILFFFILSSCASMVKQDDHGLAEYKQAQSLLANHPNEACEHFLLASQNPKFSLADLAMIRALETCPASAASHFDLNALEKVTRPAWLKEAFARAALQHAILISDPALEMKNSLEVVSFTHLQADRIRLLQRVLQLSAVLKDSQTAALAQAKLFLTAPRLNPAPDPSQNLVVAIDFRQARDFASARSFYHKIADNEASAPLDRLKALDGIRLSFKLEKKTDEYVQAAREMSLFAEAQWKKSGKSPEWIKAYADAQVSLARTLWTEVSPQAALTVLDNFERKMRGAVSFAETNWLRGRIAEEQMQWDKAATFFAKAATESAKDSQHPIVGGADRDLREKILWNQAWNLRKLGHFSEAIEALRSLLPLEDVSYRQARIVYWLAKTEWQEKKLDEARGHYQWLLQNDPIGYYGMLATKELDLPLSALRAIDDKKESAFSEPRDQLFFNDLLETGETKIAQRFLETKLSSYSGSASGSGSGLKTPSTTNDKKLLALFEAYAKAGQYQLLFSHLSEISPDLRNSILQEDPALLFPQPYHDLILPAADRFSVPSELINSIIRQESSFNLEARSAADAFGLMQVIPEIAKATEKTTGLHLVDPNDLYKPQINIPIGTAALQIALKRYHGQFILAVASYNASDKAVAGWMKTRFHGDAFEFIEDVPYEETKTYIKLVLRNYVFYKRINSPSPEFKFPTEIFDLNSL